MDIKKLYEKEKHVVIHGQTKKFRIVKYFIIFAVALVIYLWQGLDALIFALIIAVVLSLLVHFFFRWKTKGWEKSWWLYKKT